MTIAYRVGKLRDQDQRCLEQEYDCLGCHIESNGTYFTIRCLWATKQGQDWFSVFFGIWPDSFSVEVL